MLELLSEIGNSSEPVEPEEYTYTGGSSEVVIGLAVWIILSSFFPDRKGRAFLVGLATTIFLVWRPFA